MKMTHDGIVELLLQSKQQEQPWTTTKTAAYPLKTKLMETDKMSVSFWVTVTVTVTAAMFVRSASPTDCVVDA